MKNNVLFVFWEPADLLIYDDAQGEPHRWTNLEGALQQSEYPISTANIYYFREHADIFMANVDKLRDEYKHVNIICISMNCERYASEDVCEFVYQNIVNFPYELESNEYFFLPPSHNSLRAFMFYYGVSTRIPLQYLIPIMPIDERYPKKKTALRPVDLQLYRIIARRCQIRDLPGRNALLDGIPTSHPDLIQTVMEMDNAVANSKGPVLLYGPSGSGKTQIAQRLAQLLYQKGYARGPFIEVNCATLNRNLAASELFGHVKGAFTGAISNNKGLLARANNGVLFLDEISLLDMQCQGMLLRALEGGSWLPLGGDTAVSSNFFLICASNIDLVKASKEGAFREDLLARIAMWEFFMPSLRDRPDDFEANLDYELKKCSTNAFTYIIITREAKEAYLDFALSRDAIWRYNFRDLHASVQRMAAHSEDGYISPEIVDREIGYLKRSWRRWELEESKKYEICMRLLPVDVFNSLDLFELIQLEEVLCQCRKYKSMAEAGRALFNVSRQKKVSHNDSHRLSMYLKKYNITWRNIASHSPGVK